MRKTKYNDIIDYIREKIARGEWSIGSKIPSQRDLAKLFAVNRSTVITALEELTADGLIEGKMGKGTVVVNNTWTLMHKNKPVNWNENVTFGIHKASVKTVKEINETEANKKFIQLGKSELAPETFPLEKMKQVMVKVADTLSPIGYEEPRGNLELRQAISHHLKNKGIYTSPSSILIVSGALQALQLISIGLLRRGSTIFLEKPSYLYSLSVFQSAEMKLHGLPMDDDGLIPSTIPIIKKQQENAILYVNPTFHNPTGILMPDRRRQELITVCEKEQIPIIEDDVYGDLWIDNAPPVPVKVNDKYGNVLYLGSLSKSLSPGLRIGWIVGPESVIERLSDLKMQSDYGSSSLSQRVASEWLSSGLYDDHLKVVREQLKVRREIAVKALEENLARFATWEEPGGGFFIWVKIQPQFHIRNLFEKALSEGVLLNPGSIYAKQPDQYLRLSYAFASLNDIKQGIYRLGQIFKAEHRT
ncbi:PLP-dependent aminotransferase family protein [Alteribacter populi]|uniref:aminotransferase-like domain-containing protein n=1 Tax=Alteribacter populi TaxID=2011011 RepID=UPI000BBABC84|nr:PLP-dependent aminotransferase family protein [Alteribacter populi]